MKSSIKIILCQREETKSVGPVDNEKVYQSPAPSSNNKRDSEIFAALTSAAKESNMQREEYSKINQSTPNVPQDGGFASLVELYQYLTFTGPYIAGGAAAAVGGASFIKNTLGIATEWQKLRGGRTIGIEHNGKTIVIKDGMTAQNVLDEFAKSDPRKKPMKPKKGKKPK